MGRLESVVCHVAVLRRALVARAAGSWCMESKRVARVRSEPLRVPPLGDHIGLGSAQVVSPPLEVVTLRAMVSL